MEARERGEVGEEGVPRYVLLFLSYFGLVCVGGLERGDGEGDWANENRVFLHATDQSALNNGVTMDILKKYAAEPEAAGGGGSLERNAAPITPGEKHGIAKETH